MVHFCCAYGCSARFKKGSGLGFFRFPLEKSRRIQWILAVRRKDFVPNSNTRICGKHFITGRPSRDVNHPDYVPTVFAGRNDKPKKRNRRPQRKRLCEVEELPIMNTNYKKNSDLDDSELSDNDEFVNINSNEVRSPEFENSPLINAETIRRILDSEAVNNPSSSSSTKSMKSGQHFNPRLFTFIDVNGKLIAKFEEKRVKKNPLPVLQMPLQETVQIIIDKKRAKTIAVDRKAICISNSPELCCKNKIKKECIVDIPDDLPYSVEVKSEPNSDLEAFSLKSEPESDTENKEAEEDFINFFSELKDFELQNNCLRTKLYNLPAT